MHAAPTDEKRVSTLTAQAAMEGIVVYPSRDDYGRRTVILSRGAWTREVRIEQLAEALQEAGALALSGEAA